MIAPLALLTQLAAAPCPVFAPGELYPWQRTGDGLRPGDQWVRVRLDVDADGKPRKCAVLKSNVDSERRLFMCNALLADGRYPPSAAEPAGPRQSETMLVIGGRNSRRAEEAARAAWFKAHPQERSACYPR